MKGIFWLLLFSSHLLFSQNNIAIFHANKEAVSVAGMQGNVTTVAPFDLVNGMILVRASVNGALGNFILDTGAPGMVINSKETGKKSDYIATGVGGELEIGETTIRDFKWGIIEKDKVEAFTIDLSHFEKAVGRPLTGLIGHEILQQYEVYFDYPNSVIKMYDMDTAKKMRKDKTPSVVVPFYMNGHLPVIAIKVGNKKAFLGIDSGAEANLLDDEYYEMLEKNYLTDHAVETVIGLDKKEQEAALATVSSSSIKRAQMPDMEFLFLDLDGLNEQFDNRLDGLLGFPFFQQHAISINYNNRKIYVWN